MSRSPQLSDLPAEHREAFDELYERARVFWNKDSEDPIIKRAVADSVFVDGFLLRFLQRDSFNVEKCWSRLTKTMEWRKSMGMDNANFDLEALRDDPETNPLYTLAPFKTKNQEVVFFAWIHLLNTHSISVEKHIQFISRVMDQAVLNATDGKKLITFLNCADVSWTVSTKTSLWAPVLEVMRQHYPETIGSLICINTNSVFRIGFAVVKPFLGHKTAQRFQVWGNDWSTKIRQYIEPEQLPVQWNMGGRFEANFGAHAPQPSLPEEELDSESTIRNAQINEAMAETKKQLAHFDETVDEAEDESDDENDKFEDSQEHQ